MHVLITGGAGFIGSQLAARLIREKHTVLVVDNLSTGLRGNVPAAAGFIQGDVGNPECVNTLPGDRFDAVCHLAAQSSGPVSAEMPYYDLQANAASTLLLSRWCLAHGIPRFVYASSMAIYGNPTALPVSEVTPCVPRSYYGVSKLASEHILRIACQEGLQSTALRMFSVYGPGQNLDNLKQGMASIFLAYMLKNKKVPVTGSFERFRDFVFIDDVVDLWMRCLTVTQTPGAAYNVATGHPTTVGELLKALLVALDLPAGYPIQELPGSPSDQFGLYADISAVKRDLGWHPQTQLTDGLRAMVAWARASNGSTGNS